MNKAEAVIFDIEKFAVHDGPGIRTVVFLKGCPLRCIWCHNPESQSFRSEILFDSGKCTACRNCASVCREKAHIVTAKSHTYLREQCLNCGSCVEVCPAGSLHLAGKKMSSDEVLADVMKDVSFFRNSGGGITLSGGEPLAHIDFTTALLKGAKAKDLHTAVETCGFAAWEKIEKIATFTDLWLWDIKASPEKHLELTGVPFEPILENLRKLSAAGAAIILRCPLIPGINDEEAHLLHIASLANQLKGVQEINLEPYHPMGEHKGRLLGKADIFHANFASEEDKERWIKIISAHAAIPCRIS